MTVPIDSLLATVEVGKCGYQIFSVAFWTTLCLHHTFMFPGNFAPIDIFSLELFLDQPNKKSVQLQELRLKFLCDQI